MKFELLVSLRYLRSKQKEKFISLITFISIAGVAVGVAALIIVLSVMSGFDNELKEKIIGANSHIVVQKEGGIEDSDTVLALIESVPHVVSGAPFVNGQAITKYKDFIAGTLVRGVDASREPSVTNIASYVEKGTFDISGDKVIVGCEYADKFRVGLGDKIRIVSPQSGKPYDFEVSGIFSSGMYEYDLSLVFVSLENARKLFNMPGLASGIGVRVDDEYRVESVKREIQKKLGFPFWSRTWMDLNSNLFKALKLEKTVMFIILTLIVIVACFNIASSLIMIVMEKVKDIGILKAIGATRKNIMTIFTLQGFFIGLTGAIIGSGLGTVLSYLLKKYQFIKLPSDIYYIDKLPVLIKASDTVLIGLAALLLSLLAAVYPALSASRFDPVEAIRYE